MIHTMQRLVEGWRQEQVRELVLGLAPATGASAGLGDAALSNRGVEPGVAEPTTPSAEIVLSARPTETITDAVDRGSNDARAPAAQAAFLDEATLRPTRLTPYRAGTDPIAQDRQPEGRGRNAIAEDNGREDGGRAGVTAIGQLDIVMRRVLTPRSHASVDGSARWRSASVPSWPQ